MPVDLDALNPRQREAAAHPGGPLLILAGAGTGKTRVITYRVARLIESGVPADRILAVTFTNKAADELRRRIDELSPGAGALVWAHTFHAFACRLLRRHHDLLKIPKHFTIYDQADQKKLVTDCMKELGLEEQTAKAGLFVSLISRAKDDLLDAQSYAIYAAAGADASRQTAARIYALYQKRLEAAGALDFGDLLLKTCQLVKEHQSVREYYQEQFLHVLVDEYQDTNHAQYVLTKTLAAKHRNLCVVGDDDQSVYSWRGANIRNILEFERDFKDAAVVVLDQNYRSTPVILEAAGRVIRNNKARKVKNLWTEKNGGDGVSVQELANESEEASWIARRVQEQLAAGRRPKDMAVFYRTNAQSRSFEESLRRALVPYRIVGAVRFYERKEVKDALAYARVLLNPADAASLIRILNVPPRGIGKTSLDRLETWARSTGVSLWEAFERQAEIPQLTPACRKAVGELLAMLGRLKDALPKMSAAGVLARILEDSGYWAWLEKEVETDPEAAGRLNNLQELLNAVKEHEDRARRQGVAADLGQFLEEVSLHSDLDGMSESQDCLTLMTVHLSKGLEFPVVFLTGLEEGLFPISSGSASPEELEEERRLCYVGITRARERLYLTHAATRRLFGQVYANLPSRFILEAQLPAALPAQAPVYPAPAAGAANSAPRGPGREAGAPSRRLDRVRVGMRVRHPSFGAGQILAQSGSGEAAKVTVRFDDGRTTKLLVRYAPLEPA